MINNNGSSVLYLYNFNGYLDSNVIDNPSASNGVVLNVNSGGRFSILSNNIIAHHTDANIEMLGASGWGVTANIYHNTLDASYYGIYLCNYATANISNSIISHHTSVGIYKNPGCTPGTETVNVNYTLFHDNAIGWLLG